MADSKSRLTQCTDSVLGDLCWNEADSCWEGRVEFAGRSILLGLYAGEGIANPSPEEQLATLPVAHRMLAGLPAVITELQRQTARQLERDVNSQGGRFQIPAEEFSAALELVSIDLHAGGGILSYRCPRFFPGDKVSISFGKDLEFWEATVTKEKRR
jgi:hypothetical protein